MPVKANVLLFCENIFTSIKGKLRDNFTNK